DQKSSPLSWWWWWAARTLPSWTTRALATSVALREAMGSALVGVGPVRPGHGRWGPGAAGGEQAGGTEPPGVVGGADALAQREAAGDRARQVALGRLDGGDHVKAAGQVGGDRGGQGA